MIYFNTQSWFFIFALAFLGAATQVQAQGVVETQVRSIEMVLGLEGYELTHEVMYESLYEGRSDEYNFTLKSGWDYQIVSVCDQDCGDIDLCLYDQNGNKIGCDETSDDVPVIAVSPKWTGKFELRVTMYDCDINPCSFAIAVFGK
jgi:hypothetical protein